MCSTRRAIAPKEAASASAKRNSCRLTATSATKVTTAIRSVGPATATETERERTYAKSGAASARASTTTPETTATSAPKDITTSPNAYVMLFAYFQIVKSFLSIRLIYSIIF